MSLPASPSGSAADVTSGGFEPLTTGSDSLIGLAVIGKVGLVLALILGVIVVGSRLIRRLGVNGSRAGQGVRVISSAAVGQRERVVVVEVEGTRLVLGVGGGQVNKLHEREAPPPPAASTTHPAPTGEGDQGFAERFARALRHNSGAMLKGRRDRPRGDS